MKNLFYAILEKDIRLVRKLCSHCLLYYLLACSTAYLLDCLHALLLCCSSDCFPAGCLHYLLLACLLHGLLALRLACPTACVLYFLLPLLLPVARSTAWLLFWWLLYYLSALLLACSTALLLLWYDLNNGAIMYEDTFLPLAAGYLLSCSTALGEMGQNTTVWPWLLAKVPVFSGEYC